jgi:NAD(P) transhydrogenase subunit alpha
VVKIGVLKEVAHRERRVGLTPEAVAKLADAGHGVSIETEAGTAAGFPDDDYRTAGATVGSRADVVEGSATMIQLRGAGTHDVSDDLAEHLRAAHTLVAMVDPLWMPENAAALATTGANILSLELVPRITRAQSMDVLSSMATVAGYEAVLLAAARAPRMFPMLMTAAGTVPPTRAFVLGAGVAGLQAIATAKRLGAVVEAFDVRPAAVEQIQSVGAKPIQLDFDTVDSEDAGGYAKAQSEDQSVQQQRLLTPILAENDVIITTAAIPGMASPELITAEMVEAMRPGTVIVDLAAERGGNCTLTVADEEVWHDGVLVLGPTDLPSRSPRNASQMFATNVVTLLNHLTDDEGALVVDPSDEITGAMLVASGGEVVHPRVRTALGLDTPGAQA